MKLCVMIVEAMACCFILRTYKEVRRMFNGKKLVSIIIPTYNTEKYIGNCIESVIKQTYHNLEVIIVNDGSEDNTLEIITKARLRDNRIVVINQENNGPSAARNAGLKICRGDYVFFLDSDDWLIPNCIEKLISIEKKKK